MFSGCRLALFARNLDMLQKVKSDCEAAGAKEVYVASHDVGIVAECTKLVQETVNQFGGSAT